MIINKELIQKLREMYGDAFYLLDSTQFEDNFLEFKNAFASVYPNFNIAYSYKTNYIPKLCKIVNDLGGYAEVVSEMELELAYRLGVNPTSIIWNGPIKNIKYLEPFLVSGGTVNIDCLEELDLIREIVSKNGDVTINLGIRCNFDILDGVISRFGFDVDSEGFSTIVNYIDKSKNVVLKNLQCHFASRRLDYWPARVEKMFSVVERIGMVPERIDLGGGLMGKMDESLKKQFSFPVPCYKEYAQIIAGEFYELFSEYSVQPELVLEPGTAIVGDCISYVGTIASIKNVRGKTFATVLGSQKNINMQNVNPTMEIVSMGGERKIYHLVDFVGYTCIENDVIFRNYNGEIAVGDAIIISNCGSYSLVMKPPFILPNFSVLDIANDRVEVVKDKEDFDDIFHTYSF